MERLRIVSFPKRHSRNYIVRRVEALVESLKGRYEVAAEEVDHYHNFVLKHCMLFEHENGKFKVIDWGDRDNAGKFDSKEIVKSPMCEFVLKCQYNRFKTINPKIRPYFYFEKHNPDVFSSLLRDLRNRPKTSDKIYWRGNDHLNRKEVLEQIEDLLNDGYEELTDLETYWREITDHKLALSLPGLGKSCHREFEAFAVGTPVIMPVFQNHFFIDLVPNKHYIAVDAGPDMIHSNPSKLARLVRDKYNEVKDADLSHVSKAAMAYYDNYIRFEPSIKMLRKLLEL